ncbi:MAG: hypothetical protein QOH35_4352 [Acidobacteriaceae bacterium]|nr:hypothetical protein [Acidobacteriaceae bacterium]
MRPDYPSYHSSQIGFLSSSFEPRPPLATRLALLAIDLLSTYGKDSCWIVTLRPGLCGLSVHREVAF